LVVMSDGLEGKLSLRKRKYYFLWPESPAFPLI